MSSEPISSWSKERVSEILGVNKQVLIRSVIHLLDKQTQGEIGRGATIEHNGVGFNKVDAEILSGIAMQAKNGMSLSPKQMQVLRKRIPKYWRQLAALMLPTAEREIQRAEQLSLMKGVW